MSQADANSQDGDARDKPTTTGTGCYKNYDHNLFKKGSSMKRLSSRRRKKNKGGDDNPGENKQASIGLDEFNDHSVSGFAVIDKCVHIPVCAFCVINLCVFSYKNALTRQ